MSPLRLLLLSILFTAGISLLLSCDSRRDQVVQPLESGWTAAPRILAGNVTSAQIAMATVVVVTARMSGEIVSTKEVRGARTATLSIPRAGTVDFTLQGWLDTDKTVLLWSGTCSLDPENPSREATLQVGPGLRASKPQLISIAKSARDSLVVVLETTTDLAEIRYTLDGKDPLSDPTLLFKDSIVLKTSTRIRAVAKRLDFLPSEEWSDSFTVTRDSVVVPDLDTVQVPTASIQPKTPGDSLLSVVLSSSTPGATIRYTTDSTAPLNSGAAKEGFTPLTITVSAGTRLVLRAIATKNGFVKSEEFQQPFEAPARVEPVTLTKKTVGDSVLVTLASKTAAATVKFTTTGSDLFGPSASTFQLNDTIRLGKTTTIQAVATHPSLFASRVLTETITIVPPPDSVALPSINYPVVDPRDSVLRFTISSSTAGASIRYTLDDLDPSTSSTATELPSPATLSVPAGAKVSLRAIAVKGGMRNSRELKTSIEAPNRVAPVTMVRKSSQDSVFVVLQCVTTGATIRYTTNGLDPFDPSASVLGAKDTIRLGKSAGIRSVAVLDGLFASQRRTDSVEVLPGLSWTFDTDANDSASLHSEYLIIANKNPNSMLNVEAVGGALVESFTLQEDIGTYDEWALTMFDWRKSGPRDLRPFGSISFTIKADKNLDLEVHLGSDLQECAPRGMRMTSKVVRATTVETTHTLSLGDFGIPTWAKRDDCNLNLVSVVDPSIDGYADLVNNVASAVTGFTFAVIVAWDSQGNTIASPTGAHKITIDNIKITP